MKDLLYILFFSVVRDDGTNSLHKRTIYLIEGLLTLFFIALIEILIGVFNLRMSNFILYILIMLPAPFISYVLTKSMYGKGKGEIIVNNYINKRKRILYILMVF